MDDVRAERAAASWRRRTCAPACGRSRRSAAAATRTRTSSSSSTGPISSKLEKYAAAVVDAAKKEPGVVDVDTSLNVGKPELSVQLDRPKAADLGVQVSDAAEALRLLVGGDQVTTYNEGGEQYEVHVRAERRATGRPQAAIGQLTVPSSRLGSVPLENVASFTPGTAPSEINRLNRQRQVTVFANLLPGASQTPAHGRDRPRPRTTLEHGAGLSARASPAARASSGARRRTSCIAFVLSLIFMYLILAAQFESWLHPITILLSLPLTLPFALLSIIIFAAVAEHLLGARPAGAVRRREEELDPADRSRQPAARARHGRATRRSCRRAATGCGRS